MSNWRQVLESASADHSERGIIGIPDWRLLRALQHCAAELELQCEATLRDREVLTQIRDATHKNALTLRSMADRALSARR